MLRRIQFYRAVLLLLTAILVVAACNPALACESCPEKPRETSHCAINHETSALVTGQADQCSHCITHLPSQASSRAIVLNNPAHGIIADYPSIVSVRFSTSTNPVEIHAHGPPGRSSPRYVLNSSFRI
ncbi:MAG TPA: hypothetical protein VJS13_04710 [Pyrinomonadaceae bacterium]|nr:hypothetical protein [Pyrinomonadaceae bacterium]